jgi:hypothetical protein
MRSLEQIIIRGRSQFDPEAKTELPFIVKQQ